MRQQRGAVEGFGLPPRLDAAALQRAEGCLGRGGARMLRVMVLQHAGHAAVGRAQGFAAIVQGGGGLADAGLRTLQLLQAMLHVAVQLQREITDGAGDGLDLGGGKRGFFRQLLHLVGDHGKAAARLAGAGGFDGGVKRHQVGLVGDFLHHTGKFADLRHLFGQPALVAVHRRQRAAQQAQLAVEFTDAAFAGLPGLGGQVQIGTDLAQCRRDPGAAIRQAIDAAAAFGGGLVQRALLARKLLHRGQHQALLLHGLQRNRRRRLAGGTGQQRRDHPRGARILASQRRDLLLVASGGCLHQGGEVRVPNQAHGQTVTFK